MLLVQSLILPVQTHITLPLSVFDHIDNDQVQQLVEARWQEHRMEDNVIVGNSHGSRDDAVGEQLLKQQLVRAELEVNLLRQCIHSGTWTSLRLNLRLKATLESSALENSGNTINQLITPLRTFRLQDPVA